MFLRLLQDEVMSHFIGKGFRDFDTEITNGEEQCMTEFLESDSFAIKNMATAALKTWERWCESGYPWAKADAEEPADDADAKEPADEADAEEPADDADAEDAPADDEDEVPELAATVTVPAPTKAAAKAAVTPKSTTKRPAKPMSSTKK